MSIELFGRKAIVQLNAPGFTPARFTDLRVAFKIVKDLKPQPNNAEITIYNLNADSRAIARAPKSAITLLAGYGSDFSQIFNGSARIVPSTRDKVDWATKIVGGDGEKAYRSARVVESFKPGTPIIDVINAIAKSFGLNPGNLTSKLSKAKFRKNQTSFPNGVAVEGQSAHVLTEILNKVAGLTWSIQDGAIQILADDDFSGQPVVLLDSSSGLIGSPELAETGTDKHAILKIKTLLRPQLVPGARVQVDSVEFKNKYFRIDKVTHTGDTFGKIFYSDLECRSMKTS